MPVATDPPLPDPEDTDAKKRPFDEVRFFHALDGHMDRSFSTFRREMIDLSLKEHEKTRRHVAHVTSMTRALWIEVFGKDKPPPGGGDAISFALTEPDTNPGHTRGLRPIDDLPSGKISEHDATLAGFQGQLIAVDAKVESLVKLQKEQMGLRDADDRSVGRRIVDGFLWLTTKRAGHKFALTLVAALTSLVTALGTTYALSTGRLPLPIAPTSHQIAPPPSP